MSGHIYILIDGNETGIGITTDLKKRMASYSTHNPTFHLFKSYQCSIDEAKRIETVIKQTFKENLSNKKSKEWFSICPETVDRYVSTLLEKPIKTSVLPSMHGVKLTQQAFELKKEILNLLVQRGNIEQRRKEGSEKEELTKLFAKTESKKEELAELFATSFGLGIPAHKLPTDYIVVKDYLNVDTLHCTSPDKSQKVKEAVRSNRIRMPCDAHQWYFFHLVRLATNHFVALCTARVSMPYLPCISKNETIQEIADLANELGWFCTIHNDWS